MWFALIYPEKHTAFTVLRYSPPSSTAHAFIIAGFIVWEAVERFLEPPR